MAQPFTVKAYVRAQAYTRAEIERARRTPAERAWEHERAVARKLGVGDIGPCPDHIKNKERGQSK